MEGIDFTTMSLDQIQDHIISLSQARDAEKKRADAEKKRADAEKKRADAAQKDFDDLNQEGSVKNLLEAMPRMEENPACKPSIEKNDAAQEKVTEYRKKLAEYRTKREAWKKAKSSNRKKRPAGEEPKVPERFKFHEPAKILRKEVNPFEFDVHVQNGNRLIRSSLAQRAERKCIRTAGKRRIMRHDNEVSPQDYLEDLLDDAIECCGLSGQLQVVKEATLFSLRPDLVTVLVEGRLLLAVEVKNPDMDVFQAETAAGQVLDYLKALLQNGVDWPFVLLSTYNHSVIAFGTHDIEKYKEILDKGSINAKEQPPIRHNEPSEPEPEKPPTSPNRPRFHKRLGSVSEEEVSEEEEEKGSVNVTASEGYDYQGREVYFSQTYGVDDLFKTVTLLLECSWISFQESKQSTDPLLPEEGEILESKELCTLYENGVSYEKVAIGQVTYNKAAKINSMKKFHVLCQVGQGGQGKTVLCSSATGKLFAVKLYLIKKSKLYNESDRKREDDESTQTKLEEAQKEQKQWIRLAPPKYHAFCRQVTLNGVHALTMPYCPPVPLKARADALSLIRKQLENIAKKNWFYKGSDLRWRHFGCRYVGEEKKMEIILLDLGSLVNNKLNADGRKKLIDDQMENLENRMGKEEEGEAKPVLLGKC